VSYGHAEVASLEQFDCCAHMERKAFGKHFSFFGCFEERDSLRYGARQIGGFIFPSLIPPLMNPDTSRGEQR